MSYFSSVSFLYFLYVFLFPGHRFTFSNYANDRRASLLAELIEQANFEIVIFTGKLFHGVYNHEKVIAAFRHLPETVSVSIYHSAVEFDDHLSFFWRQRLGLDDGWDGVKFEVRHVSAAMPHLVIIDRKHYREELGGPEDDDEKKFALIFFDRPRKARSFYGKLIDCVNASKDSGGGIE